VRILKVATLGGVHTPEVRPENAESNFAMPFVGREPELQSLVERLDSAVGPTLVMVSGPQGIGKTRLVEEVASIAHARGLTVAKGRAWLKGEEPAYWHWTQVFASLLPERSGALENLLLEGGGSSDRLDLFDEASTVLERSSEDRAVLIILDDIHSAGSPTFLLTRFLIQQLAHSRLLVLATCRPTEDIAESGARKHLELLADHADVLHLGGLTTDAVAAMLAPVDMVHELHAATGGNPLFIEQFVKSSDVGELEFTSARHDGLAVLARSRIARLDRDARSALCALAVLGGRANIEDLAAVLERQPKKVARCLEIAVGDSIQLDKEGTYTFVHAVFAAAAYVEDSSSRAMHLRAADIIGDAPGRETELAQHLYIAGPLAADRTPTAFLNAGRAATAALAYESAAAHYEKALAISHDPSGFVTSQRVQALIGLAQARARLGEGDAARETFDQAWIAATGAHPKVVASAALGPELGFGFVPVDQPHRAARCREALDRLGPESPVLRARLTATLATHQLATAELTVARTTATAAHELAVACGDPYALGASLVALSITDLGPDSMEHRLTMARQILSLAETLGEQSFSRTGHFLLMAALLERGDVRAVDAELASRRRESARFEGLQSSRHLLWFRCMRALLDGRIEESEQLATEALATATREGDGDALSVYVGQIGIVRWMQGREAEVEPMYLSARQSQPEEAVWSAVLARLWALDGRLQAARGAIKSLGDVTAIPRDRNWLLTVATLAEAAVIVGDRDAAAHLRNELLPYAHRLVPIGLGIACWGTVARPLALVSVLLGRTDEAEAHLRTAIALCSDAGAQPWLAQAQIELSDILDADRSDEAEVLLDEAEASIRRLKTSGLEPELARRRALRGPNERSKPVVVGPARSTNALPLVRVLGTFEVVGLGDRRAPWTSRKARGLLKLLVSRRGALMTREAIMDVLWPDEDPRALSNRLSVALTTVRRAFDPERHMPADQFVSSDNHAIRLRIENMSIDAEQFLVAAREALDHPSADISLPKNAVNQFLGAALADEPYAEWAKPFRQEVHSAFARVARLLAERAEQKGDDLVAADTHRMILVEDPFDEYAHRGLVQALSRLGALGQANTAEREYESRMREIGVSAKLGRG